MSYTLTQDLITGPQTIREGMCLADWEQVPGFSWDKLEDLDALADLILPPKIAALRAYDFDSSTDSPNAGGFGTKIQLPARRAVLHWWGTPSGQNPYGIINWLCDPASQVSAHSVIWPGNVACIVNYDQPSWANGNTLANITAITIECDPNNIPGTIPTVIEYLADLVRQGVLDPDFELTGHRNWYNTTCPGTYYPRLSEIRQAVRDNLAGQPSEPTQTEDEVTQEQANRIIELLVAIDRQTAETVYHLTNGEEGIKFDGDMISRLRAIETAVQQHGADPDVIKQTVTGAVDAALSDLQITLTTKEG